MAACTESLLLTQYHYLDISYIECSIIIILLLILRIYGSFIGHKLLKFNTPYHPRLRIEPGAPKFTALHQHSIRKIIIIQT